MLTPENLEQLEPAARDLYTRQRARGYEADDQAVAFSQAVSLRRIADNMDDVARSQRNRRGE